MDPAAEELKNQANDVFKTKDYERALELYSKAIEVDGTSAVLYSNRSFAYLKTESFGAALEDAGKAIELDPKYTKGYYRRASANMAMGQFSKALKDYESVFKVKPKDPDVRKKVQECRKIVKQRAFERAIASEEKEEAPLTNYENITVSDSYKGPRLDENCQPTVEFMEQLETTFKAQKELHKRYIFHMLTIALEKFRKLPTMIDISVPNDGKLTVCGDTHGQYYDLCNIFKLNGQPSAENPYLFNGDFVDRGSWGLEVFLTLLGWWLHDPKCMYLTRGNHETKNMNELYGFEGEVKHKVGPNAFRSFQTLFQSLPVAYLINKRVLVMHGGLPMVDNIALDDIRKLDRFMEPGEGGTLTDLLWADPQDAPGRGTSKRGTSAQFGPDITAEFCKQNGLDYIIRSHEVKEKGWESAHGGKCWTIFSAPNYCDQRGNDGAYLTIRPDNNLVPIPNEFKAVEHPPCQPMMYANPMMRMAGLA
ncbi:unnamed protein product [Oikopleura dioica]|uniref:protein-serine/threonine phosphatase n=1 Tax=Oikopleura dioica TaxID=34765 RepID=E4WVX7_OIKDI|nr:unnamed protein product [Oikopleura dioica]